MAVCQAMVKGTPPGLLCELCRGVCSCTEAAEISLRNEAASHIPRISTALSLHLQYLRELFYGLACRYMAQACAQSTETGEAMGFIDRALSRHLVIRSAVASPTGLPEMKGEPYNALARTLPALQERWRALRAGFDHDNRLVYYKQVPPIDDLPDLRSARVIMRPTDFAPPTASLIVFITEEQRQELDRSKSIFRFFSRSSRSLEEKEEADSKSPSAPTSPAAGLKRTDSDLARELQAKINAGQDI